MVLMMKIALRNRTSLLLPISLASCVYMYLQELLGIVRGHTHIYIERERGKLMGHGPWLLLVLADTKPR